MGQRRAVAADTLAEPADPPQLTLTIRSGAGFDRFAAASPPLPGALGLHLREPSRRASLPDFGIAPALPGFA
jgi:hypothetical protein